MGGGVQCLVWRGRCSKRRTRSQWSESCPSVRLSVRRFLTKSVVWEVHFVGKKNFSKISNSQKSKMLKIPKTDQNSSLLTMRQNVPLKNNISGEASQNLSIYIRFLFFRSFSIFKNFGLLKLQMVITQSIFIRFTR